ncbi:hypothetical protein [Amaricoccus solimangrovi]|uniref:Uncharacterized protein n=1 Tax=Amaricoccus solimangrovi TaxID=2589815 RepID=A0A501WDV5_9RHOB|nr:hypothetical protein [Amaricoccus solimangrovi]TPE45077.1 hypothetical protein FJM51_22780 [Amaricoccus solimangrovi]
MNTDPAHKMAIDAIGFAARILGPQEDALRRLVEAERSMHSVMPITDPTLYMRAIRSDGLRQQVELAKAALAFITVVEQVKEEIADA